MRALLAAEDPRAETVYEGRKAFRLDVPVQTNLLYADADRSDLVVERAHGIPVKVTAMLEGEFTSELRIEDLVVDGELRPDEFTIQAGGFDEFRQTDEAFAAPSSARSSGSSATTRSSPRTSPTATS